jgi:hypothetical protein
MVCFTADTSKKFQLLQLLQAANFQLQHRWVESDQKTKSISTFSGWKQENILEIHSFTTNFLGHKTIEIFFEIDFKRLFINVKWAICVICVIWREIVVALNFPAVLFSLLANDLKEKNKCLAKTPLLTTNHHENSWNGNNILKGAHAHQIGP